MNFERFRNGEEELYDDPVIEAYKRDVDVTLIQENLKLTVEQRLINLERMQADFEEIRKAMLRAKAQGQNVNGDPV